MRASPELCLISWYFIPGPREIPVRSQILIVQSHLQFSVSAYLLLSTLFYGFSFFPTKAIFRQITKAENELMAAYHLTAADIAEQVRAVIAKK